MHILLSGNLSSVIIIRRIHACMVDTIMGLYVYKLYKIDSKVILFNITFHVFAFVYINKSIKIKN